ncbi:hypothetical protein ACFSQD_11740 [Flavihumibacter stibioxidans]|uniref:Uncharacterized protein n=1 Tax=Flavihumibacter stibioxidans TaxID=1834163 RepID=A0ABR7M9L7_9BACT|nr:hypothetical protein [Flavihumibacter stibioxidans]MBC6491701.1 hypothetical protein [Flavihumibacter stibioxidans]
MLLKKKILPLLFLSIVAISMIMAFYSYNKRSEAIIFKFKRNTMIIGNKIAEIELTGGAPSRIYFADSLLFVYDGNKGVVSARPVQFSVGSIMTAPNQQYGSIQMIDDLTAESNQVNITDIKQKQIATYQKGKYYPIEKYSVKGVDRIVKAGKKDYFIQKLDDKTLDNSFALLNLASGQQVPLQSPYHQYNDGGFATDGFMRRAFNGNKIFHVLYHMGKFAAFDTSGKLLVAGKTIDGYDRPPHVIKSGGKFTINRKSKAFNRAGSANSDHLFVVSNAVSESDNYKRSEGDFIDLYSTHNGNYIRTIFAPKEDGKYITDVFVTDNHLFLLQGKKISIYHL